MTTREINEAVVRKLGKYPSEEAIALAKSQLTGAGTFKITIPDYCNSIQAAWEIAEYMRSRWDHVEVISIKENWSCGIRTGTEWNAWQTADTAPLAICKAFLQLP